MSEPPARTQGEWDPSLHRLPVWEISSEAVLALAKDWKALLKAIAVPTVVVAGARVASLQGPRDLGPHNFEDVQHVLWHL